MQLPLSIFPRLRHVEVYPIEHHGEPYYYLRDPLEIAPEPLVLTPAEFLVASLFNGRTTLPDVQAGFAREANGLHPSREQVHSVLERLSMACMLNDTTFRQRHSQLQHAFREAPVRSPWHAGVAYAKEAADLHRQIEGFYNHRQGAGMPAAKPVTSDRLRAIMVPHIDLRVDGPCYSHGYKHLFEHSEADLYIILGVSHNGGDDFLIGCDKDFATPLGRVATDSDFIRRWKEHAGYDVTRECFLHRSEHSIEFQLPFLQQGATGNFNIVPVLCGSLEYILNHATEQEKAQMRHELAALGAALAEEKQRVIIILSVDLAHQGPKFGDAGRIGQAEAQQIREADQRFFRILESYDHQDSLQLMQQDLFRRRIDACGAVYTLMHLYPHLRGQFLSYGQNMQEDSGSLVSYACMAFSERA